MGTEDRWINIEEAADYLGVTVDSIRKWLKKDTKIPAHKLGKLWRFKKGKFPIPRGARNIRQMITHKIERHSEKPEIAIDGITKMLPEQNKIELFARKNYFGWDNWGLEIPSSKIEILLHEELEKKEKKDCIPLG